MKFDTKWLFLIVGVALGVVAGLGLGSSGLPADGKSSAAENRPERVRAKSRASSSEAGREKATRHALIREMSASKDYKARKEFIEQVGADDLPDLVAVFLEDAGLDGIDYRQEELLEKAVNEWVAEDVNAALAWAELLPQPKLRRYFQNMMLAELAKSEPFDAADRALAIEAGDAEFDATTIVSSGIRELAGKSGQEEAIARLLTKTAVKDGTGSHGSSQTFAEDFAHRKLLDSMAQIQREGLKFRFAPTGMLKEWAKHDPDAAHAWSLANGRVGFEEWQDVLNGVADTMGQEASGQWFLEKYAATADERQRKTMVDAFDETFDEPAARMVLADRLARQMPAELAGEFVEQVLKEHISMYSDKQAEGLALLNWYPTPEERADALIRHAGHGGVENLIERFPESRLATFGISRQTLEQAAGRAKNAR